MTLQEFAYIIRREIAVHNNKRGESCESAEWERGFIEGMEHANHLISLALDAEAKRNQPAQPRPLKAEQVQAMFDAKDKVREQCERCGGRGYLGHPAQGQHGYIGTPPCPRCNGGES